MTALFRPQWINPRALSGIIPSDCVIISTWKHNRPRILLFTSWNIVNFNIIYIFFMKYNTEGFQTILTSLSILAYQQRIKKYLYRADSRLAHSQWETSLQTNAIFHWLGTNLESVLAIVMRHVLLPSDCCRSYYPGTPSSLSNYRNSFEEQGVTE